MLAYTFKQRPLVRQTQGITPEALSEIVEEGVNLALWQRQLPAHIADFSTLLLSMGEPLAEALTLDVKGGDAEPDLRTLASAYADLHGYEGFIADVSCWSALMPACWARNASGCACGCSTKPCARAFTSIMCRCA